MQNPNFFEYANISGFLDEFDGETKLYGLANGQIDFQKSNSTLFLFASSGNATLFLINGETTRYYNVYEKMYASIPLDNFDKVVINGGLGYIAEKKNYKGFFSIGGEVEDKGRLKYIDGCTDSLLVPPVKLGDPCLNLLVFPPNTDQTMHTHPSVRLGTVISGRGCCKTPNGNIDLMPGMIFVIPTDKEHAFATSSDEGMRVVAYHPDSDFGPTDEFHPMLNRTIVGGVSAKDIEEIRTKEL